MKTISKNLSQSFYCKSIYSKRPLIIILLIFFLSNFQMLFGQKVVLSLNKKDILKIKTKGIVFVNTGDKEIDSSLKLCFENIWDISSYKIIDKPEISTLKKDNYILTPISLTLDDRFGARTDKTLGIIPLSLIDSKLSINDPIIISRLNIFGGYMDESDFKHILPYAIAGINDCLEMIINNPSVTSMETIYELINKKNSYRTKNKKILFIKGKFTEYILFDQLDKNNIKYKLVTMSEYENMNNEDLSDYVLAAFGGNTSVKFSLHDPISKNLLYIKYYSMGYLGKKRILRVRKYY